MQLPGKKSKLISPLTKAIAAQVMVGSCDCTVLEGKAGHFGRMAMKQQMAALLLAELVAIKLASTADLGGKKM